MPRACGPPTLARVKKNYPSWFGLRWSLATVHTQLFRTRDADEIGKIVDLKRSVNRHGKLAGGNWLPNDGGPGFQRPAKGDRGEGLGHESCGMQGGNSGAADGYQMHFPWSLGLVVGHKVSSGQGVLGVQADVRLPEQIGQVIVFPIP